MNNPPAPKLYVAAIGMTTPVSANTAMTAAMVRAGMNVYAQTDYTDPTGHPMASIENVRPKNDRIFRAINSRKCASGLTGRPQVSLRSCVSQRGGRVD